MQTKRRAEIFERKTAILVVVAFVWAATTGGSVCVADDFPVVSNFAVPPVEASEQAPSTSRALPSAQNGEAPAAVAAPDARRSSERVFFTKLGSDDADAAKKTSERSGLAPNSAQNAASNAAAPNDAKTPIASSDVASGDEANGGARTKIDASDSRKSSFFGALVSAVGALTLVIGVFLALIFLLKTLAPNKFSTASGAFELIDSNSLGGKTELLTIRWGNKLILAARTADKIAPLSETSDPTEIAEILAAAARKKASASESAARWKKTLKNLTSFKSFQWLVGGAVFVGACLGRGAAVAETTPQNDADAIPAAVSTAPGAASLGVGTTELDFGAPSPSSTPVAASDARSQRESDVSSEPIVAAASEIDESDESTEADGATKNFWSSGPSNWLGANGWFGPEGISASLKTILTLSILTIAPAILLMTTSFVRLSVVLTLLRQAIGAGQVPSNQTTSALAIFLTLLIMAPVWTDVYNDAVVPYSNGEISDVDAFRIGQAPIRTFLWKQIEKTGNVDAIWLFMRYIPDAETPQYYEDVPWRALAPAFLLSELKTAFLIGFQIFIPFLITDIIISCVLVSTGMMMLPPAVVSLPFKLALFVLTDGWTLVVKSLLESFAWGGGA